MYYKLGQAWVTNWGSFVLLQIRASAVTNWDSYYKLGQPLSQNRAAITNSGKMYYKLGQVLQIRAIITNWGITVFRTLPNIYNDVLHKKFHLRSQFVDILFIVRLKSSMSMSLAVIINYFLVHKMEVENLILLSTQVLLRSNKVSLA